jgi:hypothetical protein
MTVEVYRAERDGLILSEGQGAERDEENEY